jgi:hypothetical protein
MVNLSTEKRKLLELMVEEEGAEFNTFPLSFAQQRLWFLNQLEPGNPFYNIAAAIRIEGALDTAALEQSVTEIISRHEILRTTFPDMGGHPVQFIHSPFNASIPLVDLQNIDENTRETEAHRLAHAEARQPFDLTQFPLLRLKLLRLQPDEHILLVTMHHIISDGWSIGILIREVATLYDAFSTGKQSPLAPLAIQYADYAAWQREWLQGDVLQRQLSYWREQ